MSGREVPEPNGSGFARALAGKRALVTGGARRIGRAIALRLGEEGMDVAVHYRESRDDAESACAELRALGVRGVPLRADLSDREMARRLVDDAIHELGGLDLLVVSAAAYERVDFDAIDDQAWDRTLAVNLTAPFVLAQRAAAALRSSRGSIVFVTCTSARVPFRGYAPYVVSKGAVAHLTRTLALELAPEIRVNAVAPGLVLPPDGARPESFERALARIPLGAPGSPADVADAVVYLANARFVTGHEIAVDGGRTLTG